MGGALRRTGTGLGLAGGGGWTFWRGTVDGYPVIVSKTMKGVSNTAAATAIAVERYHPVAIINQGTAGGHDPELNVYDIVLGRDSVNLGSFKTPDRRRGQGSNSLEWKPMDLLASEGSAGNDPNALKMRRFKADDRLLATAESVKHLYLKGRVVKSVVQGAQIPAPLVCFHAVLALLTAPGSGS